MIYLCISPLSILHLHICWALCPKAHDTRTKNSCEKLVWVNSREKLVRVSYRLAARYFSREFLTSNRACSLFRASYSCEFLVRVSRTSFSWVCHGLNADMSCYLFCSMDCPCISPRSRQERHKIVQQHKPSTQAENYQELKTHIKSLNRLTGWCER